MSRHVGVGIDLGGQKITSLADGTVADDGAAFGQITAPFIDLKQDHGAVGDGVADDSAEWVAAVADAHSTGKPLWVPAGTYDIDAAATQIITAPVTVIGEGTLLGADVIGDTREVFEVRGGGSLTVKGITVDSLARLVGIDGSLSGTVDNIEVVNVKASTVNALLTIRDTNVMNITRILVDGCWIDTCRNGIYCFAGNVAEAMVTNTIVSNGKDRGIRLGDSTIDTAYTRVIVDSCHVHNFQGDGTDDVNGIQTMASQNVVTNNHLSEISADDDVRTTEGIYTKGVTTIVANNTLTNAGRRQGGIVIKGGVTSFAKLSDNFVFFDKTMGITQVNGITVECGTAWSSNNTVKGIVDTAGTGIEFDETVCENVVSIGDAVEDCAVSRGLLIGTNASAAATGKYVVRDFTAWSLTGTSAEGIYIRGNSTGPGIESIVVQNCVVRNMPNGTTTAIQLTSDGLATAIALAVIEGCQVENCTRGIGAGAANIDEVRHGRNIFDAVTSTFQTPANVTTLVSLDPPQRAQVLTWNSSAWTTVDDDPADAGSSKIYLRATGDPDPTGSMVAGDILIVE